jgi:quercetin dioxygenase-like cupin family protein
LAEESGKFTMKTKETVFAVLLVTTIWSVPFLSFAQTPNVDPASVIPMSKEPHHHVVLHNDYVNVYDVRVMVGDSIALHRHDNDALAIAIGDQDLTVGIPGKPDLHQKTPDGQMRLQPSGYMHSTHVNGPGAYHTVAVELLHAQTGKRNLCAAIVAGQPLNCPEASTSSTKSMIQPQFASDQTRIQVVRVPPRQRVDVGDAPSHELIVALDPASISGASGNGTDKSLQSGDFVWLDKGGPPRVFKNAGDKEARFVQIDFKP